jgi:cell division septation protein DedD
MRKSQIGSIVLLTLVTFVVAGCSRVKDDWKAAQAADTTEAYQDFLRQHPDSEFGVAAQERVRQLAEDRDWQQAAKADTLDAYQQFVAAHADGKWAPEARVRIENFQLNGGGQAPGAAPGAGGAANAPTTGGPAAIAATGAATAKPAATSTSKPKAASAAKPAAHDSTASGKSSGKHYAQLGAYSSKASAESAWHKLSGRFPTQLKSLQPHYAATTGAKPLVRLQVALPTSERVHQLCTELKQQSQPCIPLS